MQSKFMSMVESLANVVVGIMVSFVANLILLPLVGLSPSLHQTVALTALFTFVSIVRSYFLRRLFNRLSWTGKQRG